MGGGVYVNVKGEREFFELPPGWELLAICEASVPSPLKGVERVVCSALDMPFGVGRIEELARPWMRVCVLFDDFERQTPVDVVLPELLRRLNRAGVPDRNVVGLCAVGTHRRPPVEALRVKVGDEAFERLKGRLIVHDPLSKDNVLVGKTTWGTPVEVNPHVAFSDLVIGIGTCLPHPCAGFSGGHKIVMPGASSYRTVFEHHFTWMRNRKARLNLIDGNPFYEEIVEIGRLCGLVFKVDFVLNEKGEVLGVFCGDPVIGQKEAVKYLRSRFSVKVPELADVTVISSYPLEQGVQATKALLVARLCTRPKGYIVWVCPQTDPQGMQALAKVLRTIEDPDEFHREALKQGAPSGMEGLSVSYVMQLVFFKELARDFQVLYVTDPEAKTFAHDLGFEVFETVSEALRHLRKELDKAKVLVFPSGGNAIPQFDEKEGEGNPSGMA